MIGIHVHRCDLQNKKYDFRRPIVIATLLDRRKGQFIEKKNDRDFEGSAFVESISSKCQDVIEKR